MIWYVYCINPCMEQMPFKTDRKMSVRNACMALLFSGFTLSHSLEAAVYQSHESIRQTVESFVADELGEGDDVRVELGHLDSRLRLHRCNSELTAFWPNGQARHGRGVVGVRCADRKPWKMYVQVNLHVFEKVAVLKNSRLRGETLRREDITYERQDISRLRDRFLTDAGDVLGYELKRTVKAGTVLNMQMLRIPKLVKRGQRVTLVASAGGIEVKMGGEALADGAQGSVIKVKNLSSSRVVEGEVVDKGTVRIRF